MKIGQPVVVVATDYWQEFGVVARIDGKQFYVMFDSYPGHGAWFVADELEA